QGYGLDGDNLPQPFDPSPFGTGIWKSTDGGANWVNTTWAFIWAPDLPPGPDSTGFQSVDAYTDVAIDPLDPTNIYCGVGTMGLVPPNRPIASHNGIWESVDAGKNWFQLGFPSGTGDGL